MSNNFPSMEISKEIELCLLDLFLNCSFHVEVNLYIESIKRHVETKPIPALY